jgi:2-methylcitrate dehydratase
MSVSEKLAKYALELNFDDLPNEVVHQTKRLLIDTLGCAVGGYSGDASQILQQVVKELDGPPESTVIGSGIRTSCLNATLANGAMVRYLDYNDTPRLQTTMMGHSSEVIPATLAVGEREHSSGKEVITAIVLGYELCKRFVDGIIGPTLEERGWNVDTRGAYVMPLVVGKLLGLNETQLVNAVGLSGCHNQILEVVDATGEEFTMAKNLRFPFTAYGAILGAFLARRGYTGPARVIDGEGGFVKSVLGGDYNVERVLAKDPNNRFAIMDSNLKSITASYGQQGYLTALLTLTKQHNIKPEDVVKIKLTASPRVARHNGDPAKRYPSNKETADHSAYFLAAIGIIDRQIGPDQFSVEKFKDPRVLTLIDKVSIEGSPELGGEAYAAGIAEITTKHGATHKLRVDKPIGHHLNPMLDKQIEEKFSAMAVKFMSNQQIQSVFDAIYNMENLDDVGKLMRQMVFR